MMTSVGVDYSILAPELALAAAGLLVLLLDLILRNASRWLLYTTGIIGCIAAFAFMLPLYGKTQSTLNGAFANDKFSWGFDTLLVLTLAVVFLLSSLKRAEDGGNPASYASLLILCTIGGTVMAGATNLIGIFLGIELLSLSLYVLAGTGFPRESSQESALLYGAGGSIALSPLPKAAAVSSPLFIAGFALFVVGLAFKLALAPFHLWTPDVYEGSPLAVTAFMAVAVKAASFAVLARVAYTVFGHASDALIPLWALAILSMLVCNLGAIRQRNLKRLLAFSSIAQAGYVVVALAGVGASGLSSLLFYLFAYAFMNLGEFAVIGLVGDGSEAYADIDAYRGLFFRRPWVAAAMALFLMSLGGTPGTAGFYGKVLLLVQGFTAGPWGVALGISLIAGTLVSFYVYFKVIWQMFVPVEGEAPQIADGTAASWLAVGLGAAGVIVLGVLPQMFFPYVVAAPP